jgi:hypothetical protein
VNITLGGEFELWVKDPLADQPPHDISEKREQKPLARVARIASSISSLQETIKNGKGQQLFGRLFSEISDWQKERVAEELLPLINATQTLGGHERLQQAQQLLRERGQLILNLMLYVVAGLRQQFGANPPQHCLCRL